VEVIKEVCRQATITFVIICIISNVLSSIKSSKLDRPEIAVLSFLSTS